MLLEPMLLYMGYMLWVQGNGITVHSAVQAKNLDHPWLVPSPTFTCKQSPRTFKYLFSISLIHLLLSNYPMFPRDWITIIPQFSSVQSLSHVQLFATPWTAAHQASLSITNSQSLFRLMSIESSDAIWPSHPLSSSSPPAFYLSQHQGLFQWVSSSYQVCKVLELQHQSFQWIFRTDFL